MGRQPCCEKIGLKRGPWTIEEDNKLMNFILNNGIQCWRLVPKLAGLMRCGKSCRLRWINYLRPDLKKGALTEAEEDMIIQLHSRLGNRWSKIAAHFPGRTDNEIKNHWNTKIKKKMKLQGLDPVTHKPIQQKNQEFTEEIHQQEPVSLLLLKDDNQKTAEVSLDCVLNQHKIDSCNKNMDMSFFQNKETIGNFSMETYQIWMDNPFIWDSFTSLGESFP
ncbi:hypothetical protein ACS0TY_009145 [Phlomoides rotata]